MTVHRVVSNDIVGKVRIIKTADRKNKQLIVT